MTYDRTPRPVVRLVAGAALALLISTPVGAQIRVNPTGVNVNAQGATTVLLTFGGLNGYRPVEAFWCRSLLPAAPDLGQRCDPASILGSLPLRYDQSSLAPAAFTDIMSIPPSVARRAYQAAEAGGNSGFFYVRRFSHPGGGPDQYVAVTCRLSGGGARVPFALVDVTLAFDDDAPVLFVAPGDVPPALSAVIQYTGTGRLQGRWEVVLPGDDRPSDRDRLTEGTLPPEERGTQRRYTDVGRFSVFLPPSPRPAILPGPDPRRLPTAADGTYLVLLRVEVSDDKEADSNLASAGAGTGVLHAGAVAGFPLPALRYQVGGARGAMPVEASTGGLALVAPADGVELRVDQAATFAWAPLPQAALQRLEVHTLGGVEVFAALVPAVASRYTAPSWLASRAGDQPLRWRVVALDATGVVLRQTSWRTFRFTSSSR